MDRYNGLTYGAILWDFIKFFDTLDPAHLVQEAVALGFPVADLCLGLRMHLAPRRLMILGVVSSEILPLRSVLPGCIYAIAFTKVYMRRPIRAWWRSILGRSIPCTSTILASITVVPTQGWLVGPWLAAQSGSFAWRATSS